VGKRGLVNLVEVTPGFESIRSAVSQSPGKRGLTIVSSNAGLLLRVQEAFVGDERFAELRAGGVLDLVTVSQLVTKLCTAAGVSSPPTLDLDRQAALVGLVAQRLPADSPFAGSKHLPGFYEAAAKTLQELRHARVAISSREMPSAKLRDVALLQQGLSDELERRSHCTLSDRIEALVGAATARTFEVSNVLWLPERDWTSLRLALLEWMLRSGIQMELVCEVHRGNPEFFSATNSLREAFPGAEVRCIETLPTPGSALFSQAKDEGATGELTILEASDDFIETEWALHECRRRIREDGFDARDIVLFARSLETYGPLLRAAADREGLPLTMDYGEPLTAHPFARYVLRALTSMLRNDVGGVVALIRSAYGQVPATERDAVEKGIRGLAAEPDLWKAVGTAAQAGALPDWLAAVANWRRIALGGDRKPADWMRGIDQLIASTPWLTASNAREEAAKDRMVRSLHIALLALDPHAAFSLGEFVAFAERTWAAADYRVRTQGGVRVVSDPSAIGEARAVIAVGIIEGRFPSRRAEDPVLLDRDREALLRIDSTWRLADSYARAIEDDRDFYRLLCSCGDLTLCFPSSVGENPQERAAYLWDIAEFPGVRQEKRSFSSRFPKPEDCATEREMMASIIRHGNPGFEVKDAITQRLDNLRGAYLESQNNELRDDILRAKLGVVPQPLRMAHLRSLDQCPFQYFVRHRLGVRSRKGDPMNGVIVNAIRRANFFADNEMDFADSLLKGLESELLSLQGVLNEHEVQVIRCSAPSTLRQFAKVEMNARRQWQLTPFQVAPEDGATGLRRDGKFGGASVTLSPAIDVLYKRGDTGDIVPMRIGWESEENQTKQESHLLMLMHPGEAKYAMFDSYNHSRRTLYCRRTDERRERLEFKGNLAVDIGPKQIRELRQEVNKWMIELMEKAKAGNPAAKPHSKWCPRCDLGSFCRAAPYADPAVDWTATVSEDEAEP
jgi:hypothetical protein